MQLKHYNATANSVKVSTKKNVTLDVQKVEKENDTDYYLKVKSPQKEAKETAMQTQLKQGLKNN